MRLLWIRSNQNLTSSTTCENFYFLFLQYPLLLQTFKYAIVHMQELDGRGRLDEWLNYCAPTLLLFWFGSLASNTTKDNKFFTISYRI